MSQPQNPQSPPLLARFSVNNDGLDLLQVLNSGSGIIWRLNQFQAVWYAGSGIPIFIPGELPGNLYLDNLSGNIWQLQLDFTWLELPAPGGGGGGGGVTSLNLLTGDLDIVGGLGISTGVAGSNISISNTGVIAVNGVAGSPTIQAGSGINVGVVGSNINVSNTGLLSLNAITGAATAAAGTGMSIVPSGSTLTFNNTGLLSLNAITGAAVIGPGVGISVTPSGNTLNIANIGVVSLNGLSGTPSITAGSGIQVNVSGSNIQVSNPGIFVASGNPWFDLQFFGGRPRSVGNAVASTTATTTSGLPNVTLASALPSSFFNAGGIVIYKAGVATSQSTPATPTAACTTVTGSQTIKYACVGVDQKGGLTAASPAVSVTNAPAIFGNLPIRISSISQSSGIVTVNFVSPINAVANNTIHIINVTGAGAGFNGIFSVASAPSPSQITYSLAGNAGSGTVSATSTGRISNVAIITAISRASNGLVTVTTAQNHNISQNGANGNPTLVTIENCNPHTLNGQFVVFSASGNSLTYQTGTVNSAVTGSLGDGGLVSTATSYEYIDVFCPNLGGNTVQYYIYSDSPLPGGSLQLIGKTQYKQKSFRDWGQNWAGGYFAPSYVPTTAPVSAQNQYFATTILSGAGTTNLILNSNVPTSVVGQLALPDDGVCLAAADAAANFENGGTILLSPPNSATVQPSYVINSSVSLHTLVNLSLGCQVYMRETIDTIAISAGYNDISAFLSIANTASLQFGMRPYVPVKGFANPYFACGQGISMDGILFSVASNSPNADNGRTFVICTDNYTNFKNCYFDAENSGNVTPLVLQGGLQQNQVYNCGFTAVSALGPGEAPVVGQSPLGPPVGAIWLKGDDQRLVPLGPSSFFLGGVTSFSGRGILIDGYWGGGAYNYVIGDGGVIEDQAPTAPGITFWGNLGWRGLRMTRWNNDSAQLAVIANNATGGLMDVIMDNPTTSGGGVTPVVTGLPIQNLTCISPTPNLGQTTNISLEESGAIRTSKFYQAGGGVPTLGFDYRTQPIIMDGTDGGYIGFFLSPPTGVTAVVSGGGSYTANTYFITVTALGWDFGESAPSSVATVTVNGSQGILVSWSVVEGAQGYFVYLTNVPGTGSGIMQNPGGTPYSSTTTSATITSFANNGAEPSQSGSTNPGIISTGAILNGLIFTKGQHKIDVSIPTLTGQRSLALADGVSSVVVGASFVSTSGVSDIVSVQGATTSSHISITATNALAAADIAAGNVYVASKNSNSVTIAHSSTAGMHFDLMVTVN